VKKNGKTNFGVAHNKLQDMFTSFSVMCCSVRDRVAGYGSM